MDQKAIEQQKIIDKLERENKEKLERERLEREKKMDQENELICSTYDNFIGLDFIDIDPKQYIEKIMELLEAQKFINYSVIHNYNKSIVLYSIMHGKTEMSHQKKRALEIGKTKLYYQKNKRDIEFIKLVADLCSKLDLKII